MKPGNKRQRIRDGIHYETLRRNITPDQFAILEKDVRNLGVKQAYDVQVENMPHRWTRNMKDHLMGCLRTMRRIDIALDMLMDLIDEGKVEQVKQFMNRRRYLIPIAKERGIDWQKLVY